MISMDMKYTALYWALRFVENDLDVHTKSYSGYLITINAEAQTVDYGNQIKSANNSLFRHKDFVILECVDRLLSKGYSPDNIEIMPVGAEFDIFVRNQAGEYIAVTCEQWGDDYANAKRSYCGCDEKYNVLYTSRLVSGLLEFKSAIVSGDEYNYGIFEDKALLSNYTLIKAKVPTIEQISDIENFEIFEDELVTYKGKSKIVKVPDGITTIGSSAFWDNTFVEEIFLPDSLKRLGGDCFYYCTNLRKVNIPHNVWIMGNNPFAGCPKLEITNNSPFFVLENGVLFDKAKTNLIHYSIAKPDTEYCVPDSVICLGKHCFYACDNLLNIIVPSSVIRFENNPFSGCTKLDVENHSPYYIFENGIIYNKFKTTIIGCLNKTQIDKFVVPESVTLISRNSFWNCKGIKSIVLTKNIDRIGYNPFAGCENLIIESQNDNFIAVDGIVYDKSLTHVLCATNKAVGRHIKLPDTVTHINRGVFSGCVDLETIDFNNVSYIDKSSFTNCTSLKEIYVSSMVTYIGEWAFSYCSKMKVARISKHTYVDKNAFNECPAIVEYVGENLIIENDNLIALQKLLSEYEGKIDVMPIDPPYNTEIDYIGYKDSNYPNGWVAFMKPRIEIAYKLLSNKGVMFIHIDANELQHLVDLCASIFGKTNIDTLIWQKLNPRFDVNRTAKPASNTNHSTVEYVVVCYKDREHTKLNNIKQPVWEKDHYEDIVQTLGNNLDDLGTTSSAKDEIAYLLDSRLAFSTPKPMRLIKEFIRSATDKNSIVLDFFAGSGTTGHATMDLNREDGGNRKFILITNNESNIYRDVTVPRVLSAINKYGYNEAFKVIPLPNFKGIIGMNVNVIMDRPMGYEHPKHKGVFYPINYGYIKGLLGGDDEEQDVYILGEDKPLNIFRGKIIAVIHRLDDVEDKWVAAADGQSYTLDEIKNAVLFQENYHSAEYYC